MKLGIQRFPHSRGIASQITPKTGGKRDEKKMKKANHRKNQWKTQPEECTEPMET